MRSPGWSFLPVLFTAAAVVAQQPQPAPPLNPAVPDPLPGLLQQWEQKMKGINAIQASIERTQTDSVTGQKRQFVGTAKLLRPDRAELYLQMKDDKNVYERFLLTGNFLYEFVPKQQLIRVHQIPQRAPGQPAVDDNFLGLMFGMSAQETQRRYQLQLVKTDANYHYILVTPRLPADKAEFGKARLVLWSQSLLPRQVEFVQNNGDQILWDIQSINTAPKLGPADFQRPQMRGWQTQMVPQPAAAALPAAGPGAPGNPPPSKFRPSGGS